MLDVGSHHTTATHLEIIKDVPRGIGGLGWDIDAVITELKWAEFMPPTNEIGAHHLSDETPEITLGNELRPSKLQKRERRTNLHVHAAERRDDDAIGRQ